MARKKRVPLNRLVTEETFNSVKALAVTLERSEGEVIDLAVKVLSGPIVLSHLTGKAPDSPEVQNAIRSISV
jgi:hypothetical protein